MYGRPIIDNGNLLNYWLQSSAADYAALCFINLVKQIKNCNLHAIIHDAAILEVSEKDYAQLVNYKIQDGLTNIELPTKIKVLYKPT